MSVTAPGGASCRGEKELQASGAGPARGAEGAEGTEGRAPGQPRRGGRKPPRLARQKGGGGGAVRGGFWDSDSGDWIAPVWTNEAVMSHGTPAPATLERLLEANVSERCSESAPGHLPGDLLPQDAPVASGLLLPAPGQAGPRPAGSGRSGLLSRVTWLPSLQDRLQDAVLFFPQRNLVPQGRLAPPKGPKLSA